MHKLTTEVTLSKGLHLFTFRWQRTKAKISILIANFVEHRFKIQLLWYTKTATGYLHLADNINKALFFTIVFLLLFFSVTIVRILSTRKKKKIHRRAVSPFHTDCRCWLSSSTDIWCVCSWSGWAARACYRGYDISCTTNHT